MTGQKNSRRAERVHAFKVLYGLCFTQVSTENALATAFTSLPEGPEEQNAGQGFSWALVHGVWLAQQHLDTTIASFSQNWRVERIGKVELTILRLAAFELLYRDDVPVKAAINEYIELSKQFGDGPSRNFVNGILDGLSKGIESGDFSRSPTPAKK